MKATGAKCPGCQNTGVQKADGRPCSCEIGAQAAAWEAETIGGLARPELPLVHEGALGASERLPSPLMREELGAFEDELTVNLADLLKASPADECEPASLIATPALAAESMETAAAAVTVLAPAIPFPMLPSVGTWLLAPAPLGSIALTAGNVQEVGARSRVNLASGVSAKKRIGTPVKACASVGVGTPVRAVSPVCKCANTGQRLRVGSPVRAPARAVVRASSPSAAVTSQLAPPAASPSATKYIACDTAAPENRRLRATTQSASAVKAPAHGPPTTSPRCGVVARSSLPAGVKPAAATRKPSPVAPKAKTAPASQARQATAKVASKASGEPAAKGSSKPSGEYVAALGTAKPTIDPAHEDAGVKCIAAEAAPPPLEEKTVPKTVAPKAPVTDVASTAAVEVTGQRSVRSVKQPAKAVPPVSKKIALSSEELAVQEAERAKKEVQQMRERNARTMQRAAAATATAASGTAVDGVVDAPAVPPATQPTSRTASRPRSRPASPGPRATPLTQTKATKSTTIAVTDAESKPTTPARPRRNTSPSVAACAKVAGTTSPSIATCAKAAGKTATNLPISARRVTPGAAGA